MKSKLRSAAAEQEDLLENDRNDGRGKVSHMATIAIQILAVPMHRDKSKLQLSASAEPPGPVVIGPLPITQAQRLEMSVGEFKKLQG